MKVNSAYDFALPVGQVFTEPSITEPNLSYSIEQLVADYSVGKLPSLSSLQTYLDDSTDENMEATEDIRFADKADALEKFLQANSIRRSIYERVKASHDFHRKKQEDLLSRYRAKFGELDQDSLSDITSES